MPKKKPPDRPPAEPELRPPEEAEAIFRDALRRAVNTPSVKATKRPSAPSASIPHDSHPTD